MKPPKWTPRRTRSITTPVAKRLRALSSRVRVSPKTKLANPVSTLSKPLNGQKRNSHVKTTTHPTVITHVGKEVLKNGEPGPTEASSTPRIPGSNVARVVTTPREATRVSWMDYPPEPPSTSSVYSDWLLNVPNPASRASYENLSVEICRNLDYRLR